MKTVEHYVVGVDSLYKTDK